MTFQISRRGKQYLETAQTLLRVAQTMTDSAIADQLKALADNYRRRAEKASQLMRPRHSLDRLLAQLLARLPRSKSCQRSRRRPTAPQHQHRAAPRSAD